MEMISVKRGRQGADVRDKNHKYMRIADAVRGEILSGVYSGSRALPSEHMLAERYGVSRVTVRQALALLEREGLISRSQGLGTTVADGIYRYRSPRLGRVGLITWDTEDYMFGAVAESARETLAQQGFSLEIRCLEASFRNKREALQDFLAMDIDGLILEGMLTALPTPNMDLYQAFLEKGIPIVQMNGVHAGLKAPSITTDDREMIAALVDHLASLGHRSIGGLFNPTESQSVKRFGGYVDGLSRNGLTFEDSRVLFMAFKDFMYVFDNMFYARHRSIMECTAIVCTNDIVARFLEATLLRAGIDVPGRMSLTGMDNAFTVRPGQLTLTTATYPSREVGTRAAQMLMTMVRTGRDVPDEVVPMALCIGESTARLCLG